MRLKHWFSSNLAHQHAFARRAMQFVAALVAVAGLIATSVAIPTSAFADTDIPNAIVVWGSESMDVLTVPDSLKDQTITDISAGDQHALALTSDGKVIGWGKSTYQNQAAGQPGLTTPPDSLEGKTVTQIAAGYDNSTVLTDDGKVTQWGWNFWGKSTPPSSLDDKTVIAIAAGVNHSLALTSGGEIVAWGYNYHGALNVPDSLKWIDADGNVNPNTDAKPVVKISAGYEYSLALTEDGKVSAWGWGDHGELDVPAGLDGKTVIAISAGSGVYTQAIYGAAMALTSDGEVFTWGYKAGEGERNAVPASLEGKTVTDISASGSLMALTDDKQVIGWGEYYGPWTWGAPANLNGKDIVEISTGAAYSLALVNPGPLTTTISADPTQVQAGETTAVSLEVTNPNVNAQTLDSLTVTIPDGFEYVDTSSTSVAPTQNGNELTFSGLGEIPDDSEDANGEVHNKFNLGFELRATGAGSGTVELSGQTASGVEVTPSSTQLSAVAPLSTTISADPTQVKLGDTTTVTVDVTNPNVDAQTLSSLTLSIPTGFTYVEGSSSASAPTVDGTTLTFSDLGTLDANGGEFTLTFELRATSVSSGDVAVTSGETASVAEVTPSSTQLSAVAPLSTTISADPTQVKLGDTTTVTVDVTNPNVTEQTLNSLTLSIPTGFTYVTDSSSISEPTVDGNVLTFSDLGNLDADGGQLIFTFELKATSVGTGPVSVDSGQTASGVEVTPSSTDLAAVEPEPETPPTEPESPSSPEEGGEPAALPGTGDSSSPAAALMLAAALSLAAGTALAITNRMRARR